MNMQDLVKKTEKELISLLGEKKSEYNDFSHEVLKGKEKNVSKLKFLRKEIARINTILNKKEVKNG